jgi:hypothetical protein
MVVGRWSVGHGWNEMDSDGFYDGFLVIFLYFW